MKPEQLQEGAFCQLKIGRWDASVRLPKGKLGDKVPKNIIRATQDLIDDRTLLNDIATIKRAAKGYLVRNSLPFSMDGVFWVNKEQIPALDEKFKEFEVEYKNRLDKLVRNYIKMKNDFRKKYPTYYNGSKYPTASNLRRKFYFKWQFFQFTIPDKKMNILPPSIYKKEKEKMLNLVKDMEEMTITMVGNLLIKRVQKLSKQCVTGKINGNTVNSIEKFMGRWDTLWGDYVDEKRMKTAMKKMKEEVKNMSTERLNNNEDFRNKMAGSLESVINQIKNIPGFELKRKLDI